MSVIGHVLTGVSWKYCQVMFIPFKIICSITILQCIVFKASNQELGSVYNDRKLTNK